MGFFFTKFCRHYRKNHKKIKNNRVHNCGWIYDDGVEALLGQFMQLLGGGGGGGAGASLVGPPELVVWLMANPPHERTVLVRTEG